MKKVKNIFNTIIILCIIEFIVLSFSILYGLVYGFKTWNWIIIVGCILGYLIFTFGIII